MEGGGGEVELRSAKRSGVPKKRSGFREELRVLGNWLDCSLVMLSEIKWSEIPKYFGKN